MYCTPDRLRDEGISAQQADDSRLKALCEDASRYIDAMTGQFFEPRKKTIKLDGNGGEFLPLPFFLINSDYVLLNRMNISDYTLYNSEYDRVYPKMKRSRRWTKGDLNIEIRGIWGYVDFDDEEKPITPPLITKAAIRIAIMQLPTLGDVEAQNEKFRRGMIQSETTDGHSYSLNLGLMDRITAQQFTGDPEIDQILTLYSVRRLGIGRA